MRLPMAVLDAERPIHLVLARPVDAAHWTLERAGAATVSLTDAGAPGRPALSAPTPLTPGDAVLVVRAGAATQRWPLRLVSAQAADAGVRAALADCRGGAAERGVAALDARLDAAPAAGAHDLLVEKARCLQAARRTDEAFGAWVRAAQGAGDAGQPFEKARRLRAAAFVAIQARRLGEARALLDSTAALDAPPDPTRRNEDGLARTAYYLGLLEGELGNVRQAVRQTEAAVEAWAALGLETDADRAREWLVYQYQRSGQYRRAGEVLAALRTPPESRPADRARFLHNQAWFQLQEMQRGDRPRDYRAVGTALTAARDLFRTLGDAESLAEAEVNLAWVALLQGDRVGAARGLAALEKTPGGLPGFSLPFVRLLAGEVALADGRAADARAAFERSARAAREESGGLDSEERWRALYGQGRALRESGDTVGAEAAFRAALDALERLGRRALLRETRAGFFDDRRSLIDDAVALALAHGDAAGAFEVVVRTQARVLRSLESSLRPERLSGPERAEWQRRVEAWARARGAWESGRGDARLLSARKLAAWEADRAQQRVVLTAAFDSAYALLDQAAPEAAVASVAALQARLAPDERLLDFHRVAGQPHVFVVTHAGVTARALPTTGPADWLETLTPALEGARHLFVVPGDVPAARVIPVSGILDRDPVWRTMSVSLLPHAGLLPIDVPPPAGRPVVVADPSGNLPAARAEGEALARRYPDARVFVGSAARRADVLAALDGARHFHFSGHGFTRPDEPWDAHLVLAEEQNLTLADILVSRVRLGVVVLSGCETGAPAALGAHESVGLPDAFLAAGARAVLATERPVGDAEARAFVERFHAAGGATTPAEAWRIAVEGGLAAGETGGEAFRLFGGR
jgi:tetratricopeptide (TPR) repeat protein